MSTTPTPHTAAPVTDPIAGAVIDPADLVAAAVLGAPGVARLHGGRFGEVATYLPRRRVVGIRLRPDTATATGSAVTRVEVHVVARYPASVAQIDVAVRAAVATALAGHPEPFTVAISVEDLIGDHPAIGGPVGDHPVTDTVKPAVVEPENVVHEDVGLPAEPSSIDHAERMLTDLPAATRPGSGVDALVDPVGIVSGHDVIGEQLIERVITERTVTEDGVTDRVTIEHTVVAGTPMATPGKTTYAGDASPPACNTLKNGCRG